MGADQGETGADLLILVNDADEVVGHETKARCHDGEGLLHRAFSVFLFNPRGELMLQQRSDQKRLWPLFWSNSCCSHPRQGEAMDKAAARRVREELGIDVALRYIYKFQYHAAFRDLGSERELCSVFIGRTDVEVKIDPAEIAAVRWTANAALTREMREESAHFTPWFMMEWRRLNSEFADELRSVLVG
jgi:isopentenyl-diphosphate Delta-isomerase